LLLSSIGKWQRYHSADGNHACRHDARSGASAGHACPKTTRARHSNWPRQHEARTSQSSRSHDEPQRRTDPGRHDSRGSQAPSAP
jgi:hypothetical protein